MIDRPPQSENRRQYVHGPLRPMDGERLPLAGILQTPAWRAILLGLAVFWGAVAWLVLAA